MYSLSDSSSEELSDSSSTAESESSTGSQLGLRAEDQSGSFSDDQSDLSVGDESESSVEVDLAFSAKPLAYVFMKRVITGLYSIESDKQIDAVQMYDWLQKEFCKNHHIIHHWKMLMYDQKTNILTRVLHIMSITHNPHLQLMAVKALNFLAQDDNITDTMINAGGMSPIISMLLSFHEELFSESLKLMQRLLESGNYGDEKTVMIHCGVVSILCHAFMNFQNAKILQNIADFWFSFFYRLIRDGVAPKREVSQVCCVLNLMLQQTEGILADEIVQAECLSKVHWHDCEPYWLSFVESGLIVTLTEIVVSYSGSKTKVKNEAQTLLCNTAAHEPVVKLMVDGGILKKICDKANDETEENDLLLLANMLISCDEIKNQCISGGVVEYVLRLMENSDKAEQLEYSILTILGNIFQPNPKNVPKEYSERILPILVKSLRHQHEHIVRMAMTGMASMTATYDGDQFENVNRLKDCGVLPWIVETIDSEEGLLNGLALLLANNMAFSGNKSVIQALLDAGVLANALSTLNRAASYHQHHFQMEVAKLVMWITMAGFGKDVVHEQARCFGVLLKKLREKKQDSQEEKRKLQVQMYSEEDLINFGSHILETRDIRQIKKLLDMDHFSVFLFSYPETSDPLRDKKLKFLVKTVDITRELGYRRIYCFYAYHVNKMLKMTKFEETRSLLTHVVSGLCSRLDEEELLVSAATQKTRKFIP